MIRERRPAFGHASLPGRVGRPGRVPHPGTKKGGQWAGRLNRPEEGLLRRYT